MTTLLFENEDILAVDKPEGLASTPEGIKGKETLLSLLQTQFPEKLDPVYRLDKEASGVILFARNAVAYRALNDQFNNQVAKRTYIALTHGVIKEVRGTIKKPLREFGSGRMGVDLQRGKPCATEFHVMKRFDAFTLLKIHPLAGRRHQIRVHLYSIDHPIVGDLRYGEKEMQSDFPRMMLHAHEIAFKLPSGEEVKIESPLPESFRSVIEGLSTYRRESLCIEE